MRKIPALLAAAALATLVATPSSASAPETSAPSATVSAMSQDTYLVTVRGFLAGQPGDSQSDADLIAGGKSICAEIDDGATYDTFLEQMEQYELNRAVYRVLIRSSVLTFCPNHAGVLR